MKKLFFIACILLCQQSFALEFAKYPIKLTSAKGENVVIIPSTDKKQALVKVTGINHEIDDIVFLTDLKPHGSNNAYKYTYDGTQRSLVSVNAGYRCCSYTLYIPDTRDGIYLTIKEESNPVIVEDIKAQYQQQLSNNTQAKLATFNREKHLESQQKNILAANKEIDKQCGLKINTYVDWKSIDDTSLKQYAVGSFCAQVAKEIASMCKKDQSFKSDLAQFNAIECQFTNELKLRKNNNTLIFKTAPKAANQRQFIEAYLLNL
ncbi:hypothetical protein [Pseudoalteromonas sp. JB197]|uniref:hypothetical protein n=1 Tax=Pseudoalteromonas sp. JB197 TaxID=1434839 RepID=UPI00097E9855|nr:hypothetical protein [Pseudoalteromonas sp. JB197]PCC12165.1 hypothetical protein CIK86_01985 [Pseudoalteromonas sp. JB197]SJN24893.1 hypothetical protein CZ797_04050 [Pseudoalteromonas sp. JB197]